MKPRSDVERTTSEYIEQVNDALDNTVELMKLVDNDVVAENLIKMYGQLKEMNSSNADELLNDILEFNLDTSPDPDKRDRQDLVEFQTIQSRSALDSYLWKKMNASFSGIFTYYDRRNDTHNLHFSYEHNLRRPHITEDNLEALIVFVNKGK